MYFQKIDVLTLSEMRRLLRFDELHRGLIEWANETAARRSGSRWSPTEASSSQWKRRKCSIKANISLAARTRLLHVDLAHVWRASKSWRFCVGMWVEPWQDLRIWTEESRLQVRLPCSR